MGIQGNSGQWFAKTEVYLSAHWKQALWDLSGREASQLISPGCSGDSILGCPAISTQPVAYCTFTFGSRLIPAVGSRILLWKLIPQSKQCCEFATASSKNTTFLFSSVHCFTNDISSPYFYIWGEQFFLPSLSHVLTVPKKQQFTRLVGIDKNLYRKQILK